jgi:hypothetical protein
MASVTNRNTANSVPRRRFGSEREVSELTGFSVRTLQKDRLFGRKRFPWYKCGGKILYDLDEIEATVRASRSGAAA